MPLAAMFKLIRNLIQQNLKPFIGDEMEEAQAALSVGANWSQIHNLDAHIETTGAPDAIVRMRCWYRKIRNFRVRARGPPQ